MSDRRSSRARCTAGSTFATDLVVRLWAVLLVATACTRDDGASGTIGVATRDSAGVEVVTIVGSVESLPEWRLSDEPIAVVSGDAAPFLSWVGEIEILEDGRFWIEDNQSAGLYLFEADAGSFRMVGREGDGPGEFRNLTELSLGTGDTAFAYDRRLYRISVFDDVGDLVGSLQVGRDFGGPRSLSLDAWGFGADRLLLLSDVPVDTLEARTPRRDYSYADLYALDRDGEVLSGPTRFDGGYSIRSATGDGGAHFGTRPIVATGAASVVWGSGDDYELIFGTPLLEPTRIVRWAGWRVPLSDSVLAHVRDTVTQGMEPLREQRPDLAESILSAAFDPVILPDTLPALGQVLLDDRGRSWVAKFQPSTEGWRQENVWHVLGEDGRPVARLRLGPLAQLKAVRGDRVAIVVRDDFEVEHVRIHRLTGVR